jgi:SAM-dependent methyltransferase
MLSMPDPNFPKVSGILPAMASEETQMHWTGAAGVQLLTQSIDFVRSVAFNFHRFTGESLENKTVLDFGCGYGRIARLMYFLTTTDNFFAVDPMNGSIEECAAHGLTKNFLLSNWSATDLPTGQRKFSLIFSFSVFTHLSETAARIALTTLLRHLEPNGLLVISIRPVEYWYFDKYTNDRKLSDHQVAAHNREGFSFLPHGQEQGIPNYGEASMTPAWIESSFPGVEVLGLDRSISDPCQIYVFMRNTDSAG